jgi:hypothetical protein
MDELRAVFLSGRRKCAAWRSPCARNQAFIARLLKQHPIPEVEN